MAAKHEDTATKPLKELTFTRVLDAPRELVFRAWTDPAHLARWWGPNGFTHPSASSMFGPEARSASTCSVRTAGTFSWAASTGRSYRRSDWSS